MPAFSGLGFSQPIQHKVKKKHSSVVYSIIKNDNLCEIALYYAEFVVDKNKSTKLTVVKQVECSK